MAKITAGLVRDLREKTGAGMMDCKRALTETDGDLEAAMDWLRKKGLSAAAKKSDRLAAEGLVGAATAPHGTAAALVEVNAETDFVARNEHFQTFVTNVTALAAAEIGNIEELRNASYAQGVTTQDEMTRLIALIGENMSLRRVARLSVKQGAVSTYVHNATAPGMGKIGVLIALESTAPQEKVAELGRKIAMHVAAASPQALVTSELPAETIARERAIFLEQARASGKPEDFIEKMVDGRMRKYYEEVVLMEQTYIIDGKTKISDLLTQASQEVGAEVQLTGYVRYFLGEGIERPEAADFAAEVQAVAGTE